MKTERWTNRQTEEGTDRKTHLDAAFFAVLPQDTQVGGFHAHPVKYRQVAVLQCRQLETHTNNEYLTPCSRRTVSTVYNTIYNTV